MEQLLKLKDRPVLTSVFGWLLFPSMYMLVGIFTALGVSVETSFILAAPVGILGFICWVAAFFTSLGQLAKGQLRATSIGGMVSSSVPLLFLGYGFWVVANGGV